MKKYSIITIILIGIILGFLTGLYLYKIKQIDTKEQSIKIAETIEDECTQFAELNDKEKLDLISTSNGEEKTSPNCVLTIKIYYNN